MRVHAGLVAAVVCGVMLVSVGTAAAACPNEAFRVGPSASLPDCQAYEMVTPADKEGGGVTDKFAVSSDPAGEAVGFFSTVAFAGAPSAPLTIAYRAARSAGDWATEPVDPPQLNTYGLFEFATAAFSPDLSRSLQVSRLALTPGAIEGGSNLYLRDNLTGQRQLVAAVPGKALFEEARNGLRFYAGGTADWSNLLIQSSVALRPGDPEYAARGFQVNVYEFRDGILRLAAVRPAPEEGLGPEGGYAFGISRDGSEVGFVDAGSGLGGPVYLRIDGSRTIPISASQRAGTEGQMAVGSPQLLSADGERVYFANADPLVDGSEPEGSTTLYRYDVGTEKLVDLFPTKPAGGVNYRYSVAASEEGDYLYFLAGSVLAEGAGETTSTNNNLYLLHGGEVAFIATVENGNLNAQASPDGHFLGFESATPLTEGGGEPGPVRNVYVYDADTRQLSCATCAPTEPESSSLGNPEARPTGGPALRRTVLDNGTVFVQSANRLVPRDVNGLTDVYAWHAGQARLVSTGTGDGPAKFANASADGSNVFFLTSQPLVPQDRDDSVDVYDDREGGGLASQYAQASPAPCEGEACRGPATTPPAPAPSASTIGGGSGSCVAISAAAAGARGEAAGLTRRAKGAARAAKQGHPGARARAKGLRRRLKATRKRAGGLTTRANTCRGVAR